jgi:hypothetical protein
MQNPSKTLNLQAALSLADKILKAGNVCENNRSRLFQGIRGYFVLDTMSMSFSYMRELCRHHIHRGQMADVFMENFLFDNWPDRQEIPSAVVVLGKTIAPKGDKGD